MNKRITLLVLTFIVGMLVISGNISATGSNRILLSTTEVDGRGLL